MPAKDFAPTTLHADISHEPVDAQTPAIHSFFEKVTGTWQYILVDPATLEAVIVDPVLDYDPASGAVSTASADRLLAYVEQEGLKVTHILYVYSLPSVLQGDTTIGIHCDGGTDSPSAAFSRAFSR